MYDKWRPSSLSDLTPIISNIELTHLGSEVSKYKVQGCNYTDANRLSKIFKDTTVSTSSLYCGSQKE